MFLSTEKRHYRHICLRRWKNKNHSQCELYKTALTLKSSPYCFQEATWWWLRADWHRFANKKSSFALIPELRNWAATTIICFVKLLPGTKSIKQHKHTKIDNRKDGQGYLPFIFIWLWGTTRWSTREEVKVCQSVHLNVIKVNLVIWPSINLRGRISI